ncbi:SDR family NAD(P)-dependent oxidoreductase [Sphingomonas montanisoli]|uniref:SDR family NAD(P)-dependent oxidoreductase n=1 Tax=Sphingomonas montanisoli TaxID=2606412 RepID=A0A5D9C8U8_9SPHN|nr:SDR family NAD(P)-dependent oxidoreductase [Sphingomonas montanisoli]TZG27813.1 SDR family NAD(P)-dependent oxidoreductase [Sphingomonas montanisoli]
MAIDFSGRVAIVTGAGRGMGRDIALSLARRNARVLVNDYGGGVSTLNAGGIEVAQTVVDEIAALGGEAIADASDIGAEDSPAAIVDKAFSAFGRVDILVNNAGGNRGDTIDALDDAQVMGLLRTNFIGGYMLLRRCWPHMRDQGFGRIVNIMSSAMLGRPGTAAYAAAKMGLLGVTNVAAIEGEPYDIRVNGVLPVGNTRLVGGLTEQALIDWMANFPPHLVGEAVAYFCAPECKETGEFYSVGAGRVARNAIFNATGFHDAALTAESLAANIGAARDMTDSKLMRHSADENASFFSVAPWPLD